MTDLYTSNN